MRVQRVIVLAFAILLLVSPAGSLANEPRSKPESVKMGAGGRESASAYPAALVGQWEPGPNPCKLPLTYDSDGGFKISTHVLQGYEHSDTPKRVRLISGAPKAWRIEAIEQHDGDKNPVVDLYVLSGDYLTVTDGERSTTYNRCH